MVQIDDYIKDFLDGSLEAEGHAVLRQWIKEAPENKTYFRDTITVWKAAGIVSDADDFNVEKAISKFRKDNKFSNRINFYKYAFRISAVAIVFLLCGISSLFFLWQSERTAAEAVEEYKEYVVEVPDGAKSKITFPD